MARRYNKFSLWAPYILCFAVIGWAIFSGRGEWVWALLIIPFVFV